jgi:hypothetical protein
MSDTEPTVFYLKSIISLAYDPKMYKKLIEERLKSKLIKNKFNDCWEFSGEPRKKDKYYEMHIPKDKKLISPKIKIYNQKPYRLAFALWRHDFDKNLDIDHLCRNIKCCNPKHLIPITRRKNIEARDKAKELLWEKSQNTSLTLDNLAQQLDILLMNIQESGNSLNEYLYIVENATNRCRKTLEDNKD